MKKFRIFAAALAILASASCMEETIAPETVTGDGASFIATRADYDGATKTQLVDGCKVEWKANNEILVFGKEVNNATRWLVIGGVQFQPSELTKIMLILFYAQFIAKHHEKLNSLKNIAAMLILLVPPLYLVYDQPDMSTSIVIVVAFSAVPSSVVK